MKKIANVFFQAGVISVAWPAICSAIFWAEEEEEEAVAAAAEEDEVTLTLCQEAPSDRLALY